MLDTLAGWAGISYPPAALFLFAAIVLFVKTLYSDMTHTRLERDIRRLNQRIAMLEVQFQSSSSESMPSIQSEPRQLIERTASAQRSS
jgi:hypothetical protein